MGIIMPVLGMAVKSFKSNPYREPALRQNSSRDCVLSVWTTAVFVAKTGFGRVAGLVEGPA
jgi:hypothetical protein